MRQSHSRVGMTLIELLVVIVILGIAAGVTGLAIGTASRGTDDRSDWRRAVARARSLAIATGSPVRVRIPISLPRAAGAPGATGDVAMTVAITALPDGSVLAPPSVGITRFTGRPLLRESPP